MALASPTFEYENSEKKYSLKVTKWRMVHERWGGSGARIAGSVNVLGMGH